MYGQHVFNSILQSDVQMNPKKQAMLDKIEAQPRQFGLNFARVGTFSSWCSGNAGNVQFMVPGSTQVYTASGMRIDYVSEQEYTYIGKIAGDANANFAIGCGEEGIAGFISLHQQHFLIYPLGGNEVVIIKDPSPNTGNDCMVPSPVYEEPSDPEDFLTSSDYCSNPSDDCYALIDVLAVTHPTALGLVPPGFATLASLQANTVILNSGIINKDIRVRLTNPSSSSITITTSPGADVGTLRNHGPSKDWRDRFGADIFVLLIPTPWVSPTGVTTFGVAYSESVKSKDAFAIVSIPAALGGRFTFVHEACGHLLGAKHSRLSSGGDDDSEDCGHGFRYMGASGLLQHTVMANLPAGSTRIPFFSNPTVSFDGGATGVDGSTITTSANNVRKLKKTFCKVEGHRSPARMYGLIQGPIELCPEQNVNYVAEVTYGSNPGQGSVTTYLWAYSNSPTGPFTSLATNNANNAWVHYNLGVPNQYLYLRLTLFSGLTPTYTTTKRVLIHGACLGGDEGNDRSSEKYDVVSGNSYYTVYPNPANQFIQISASGDDAGISDVILFDIYGKEVKMDQLNVGYQKDVQINTGSLTAGIYLVRFTTPSGIISQKIIINKN
jgi:Secretion system C-terminal sorting domain/Metallo-peptidase family M12B Reprolysin-like